MLSAAVPSINFHVMDSVTFNLIAIPSYRMSFANPRQQPTMAVSIISATKRQVRVCLPRLMSTEWRKQERVNKEVVEVRGVAQFCAARAR